MSSSPLVSILIVTYNAAKYLPATLASCQDQTYPSTEILILDNASTDSTVDIMQRQTDPRIQFIQSGDNIGPYHGLNLLLEKAQGKYIAIQDHDDIWFPTKLEKQVAFLETHPDFIACGTRTYYYYEGHEMFVLPQNPQITDFVDHTSLMFHYGQWRYQPHQVLPDEFFERRTLLSAGKIGCLQEGLTIHRIRSDQGNLSQQKSRGNIHSAWSHWQLTQYRDLLGSAAMLITRFIPAKAQWWLRRHGTLRHAQWLTTAEFKQENTILF